MTRKVHKKRFRPHVITVAAVLACTGLVAPFVIYKSVISDVSLSATAVIAATRDGFTLTSPISLPLMPNVMIETGRLSVARANPDQQLTGSETIALLAAGNAKLVLDDAVLSLVPTQSSGSGRNADANPVAPVLAALLKVSFSRLQLRDAIVHLGRGDDEQALLTNVNLDVTKLDPKKVRVTGSFEFRKKPVAFDIVMGTEAELQNKKNDGTGTIGRAFDIKLAGDLLKMTAAGTLSAGDRPLLSSTTSSLEVSDLRKFARWIGIELGSGSGLGAFQARGPLEFSPSEIAFSDATFSLDGNEATGAFSFKWGGDRRRAAIDGTLAFKSYDIGPFLTPQGAPRQNPATSLSLADYFSLTASHSAVLPLADQIDADLRVSATTVSAGAIKFGRGAATFSLKDGALLADLAELEIGKGARCGGQLGLHAEKNVPSYTLRGKIETIDLAVLTNALWSYNVLAGAGDVTLDLKATGRNADQIIATMNGKIGVRQTGSGQVGLDLRTLAATARTQTQKGWGGAVRGQTAIQDLKADFTMTNGLLVAEQIAAKAGDAALSSQGSIDFGAKFGDVKIWITHPAANGVQTELDPTASKLVSPNTSGVATVAKVTAGDANGSQPQAAAQTPGGGLHLLGPLDAPEIRFIPLQPAAAGNAVHPRTQPPAPPAAPAHKG